MLRYSQDSFLSSSLSSFYFPNNTTVGTYASLQLSRAGQQGPTRTLTAALKRLIKHLLDIHSTTRVQFWAQLYRDTSLSRWNLLIKARVVHGLGWPMGWVSQLMGWVGSGHTKWTRGQLWWKLRSSVQCLTFGRIRGCIDCVCLRQFVCQSQQQIIIAVVNSSIATNVTNKIRVCTDCTTGRTTGCTTGCIV